MPILVQWKWMEQTKSFIVIFHFFDDFSQPNLRMKEIKEEYRNVKAKALLTWAPSHVELGLLSDILRYANIIDGLNENVKRKLRERLEMIKESIKHPFEISADIVKEIFFQAQPETKGLIQFDKVIDQKSSRVHLETAVLLCPEYIEYLKKALKPYLRT